MKDAKHSNHRYFDLLPLAGAQLVDERREDRLRAELARDLVGDKRGEIPRVGVTVDAREQAGGARRGLDYVVVRLKIGIGAILTKASAMDVDDVGLERLAALIVETEARDRLAAYIVEKDVGGRDKIAQHRSVFGLFDIERDRSFSPVHRQVNRPHRRIGNAAAQIARDIPQPGVSTLMISAPRSASICVA